MEKEQLSAAYWQIIDAMVRIKNPSPIQVACLKHQLAIMRLPASYMAWAMNELGDPYQVTIKPQKSIVPTGPGLPCRAYCGKNWGRWHFTCVGIPGFSNACRLKQRLNDQMPEVIPIDIYQLAIRKDRKYAKLKAFLLKKLLSLAEVLAN